MTKYLCQNIDNGTVVTGSNGKFFCSGVSNARSYPLIFNESDKSISVTLRNNDPKLPYLAQSWIEDEKGVKISSPLAVLPPVQRIEAMMNGG